MLFFPFPSRCPPARAPLRQSVAPPGPGRGLPCAAVPHADAALGARGLVADDHELFERSGRVALAPLRRASAVTVVLALPRGTGPVAEGASGRGGQESAGKKAALVIRNVELFFKLRLARGEQTPVLAGRVRLGRGLTPPPKAFA